MTDFVRAPMPAKFAIPPMPLVENHDAQRAPSRQQPIVAPTCLSVGVVPFLDERDGAQEAAYKTMQLPLPTESGIYFVVIDQGQILYVGQAINLKKRWYNHHLLPVLRSPGKTVRVAYELCPVSELDAREAAWLTALRPPMNTPAEIARATNPLSAVPMAASWHDFEEGAVLASWPWRDAAQTKLKQFAEAMSSHVHDQRAFAVCTQCIEQAWCVACLGEEGACDCWQDTDSWPWVSIETFEALVRGVDAWQVEHPERSIWDIERLCKRIGGNRIRFAPFILGLYTPSLYEATIFSHALGTMLPAAQEEAL